MKKLSPEMKQFETEARKASASTSTLSVGLRDLFLSFYSFYDILAPSSWVKVKVDEVLQEIKAP